ncbi:MAG: zinc ribbon domain-containing protein [Oscillospiraceae bacterium]|nr:zinc ribbon domain-containing protein [Oscillospiraceae bacterium]
MICLNCGKHVDDDVRVCPFCGSAIADEEPTEADPLPINLPPRERIDDGFERIERDEPAPAPAPAPAGKNLFNPGLIFGLLSLILSLLCLVTIFSLRGAVRQLAAAQTESLNAINASVSTANDRLDQLDSTLAKVQSEAYEKVASQSIAITKDITPLTGPVDEGKNNQMFIVRAKGNLNVDTSFDWQKYNEATGGWVSIVFTGDATTNEQYGLRLENQRDATNNEFTTILWAQFITQEAAGTYRCVITDATGITKTSAEATVSIKPAEG